MSIKILNSSQEFEKNSCTLKSLKKKNRRYNLTISMPIVYNFLYTTCTRKTKPPKSCIFSAWSRFIVRSRIDISHAANQPRFGLRLSASIPDYNAHHTSSLPLLLHPQLWFIVGSPIPTCSLFATLRRVSRFQVSVQSNSVCAILIPTYA